MIHLSAHHYDGSQDSAVRLSSALINAGYQVHAYSPSDPLATTKMWVQAREAFPADALETGFPRDFRALVSTTPNDYEMVLVPLDAELLIEGGALSVRTPTNPVDHPGLSTWSDGQGETYSFAWDGTSEGFVDLISFFQINGSQLRRVDVAQDRKGETEAFAGAYNYLKKKEYGFPFEQNLPFAALQPSKVTETTTSELVERYTLVAAPTAKRFKYTPFAQSVFTSGIVLVPSEEKTPWYKKWWVWLLVFLGLVVGFFFAVAATDTPQSEDEVVQEVIEEETVEEPVEEPEPEPEPEPQPAPEDGGGKLPDLPDLPDVDLPDVNLPDIDLPNVNLPDTDGLDLGDLDLDKVEEHLPDGWLWPWDPGFKWPWQK